MYINLRINSRTFFGILYIYIYTSINLFILYPIPVYLIQRLIMIVYSHLHVGIYIYFPSKIQNGNREEIQYGMSTLYSIGTYMYMYMYTVHVHVDIVAHVVLYCYTGTCIIYMYTCTIVFISVFDKLMWCTIGPKSFLFGTAQFSLWARWCS